MSAGAWWIGGPVPLEGVQVPILPAFLSLAGAVVLVVFALQAFRRAPAAVVRASPPPAPTLTPPPALQAARPAPSAPQYKRAPVVIHFPQLKPDHPDVWGVGEPFDIVLRIEDRTLADQRQVPGLTLRVDGEVVQPTFVKGGASLRRTFAKLGEHAVVVDWRMKDEKDPRRTTRTVRVVEYRTEIADLFTNFREEANRAITPIREDATPWEIFDLITGANPKIAGNTMRAVVACFEEAKYSNHPVTRATYERMIDALLELERVEL